MKDIKEYLNVTNELFSISENPNFSDDMRNKAQDIYCYIIRYCKDAKGGIVPPNQGKPIVNEAIGEMKFTPKRGKAIIKMGGKELTQ
ncbi:MAG: hypothetical protein GY795_11160 [Desulfobacterales bacterium]|nr:hypothetical protein [Desulfobacterales bacterium]